MQWRRPILALVPVVAASVAIGAGRAQPPRNAEPPVAPLVAAWTVTLPDQPAAAPAVDTEYAYVPLRNARLAALSLRDGATAWSVPLDDAVVPPAAGAGLVLVAHATGVEALDARNGTRRWRAAIDGTVSAPLFAESGWLLVITDAGRATMMRAATGERLWERALGSPSRIRPAASGRRLYVGLDDGRVAALALETGRVVWEVKLPAAATTLHPLEDRVFVGASDRFFYCLSADKGKRKWRWRTGGAIAGSTTVDGDRVCFASLDNVLRALNRADGNQRWKAAVPHRPTGGPFLIGELLFVAGVSSELPAFRATDGRPAGTVKLGSEVPGTATLVPAFEGRPTRLLVISADGVAQVLEPPR